MKTKEEILTEIYKRSITHIDGYEKATLNKGSMLCLSEILEAMDIYASQFIHPSNCYNCNGTGVVFNTTCINCNGVGKIVVLPTITTTGT